MHESMCHQRVVIEGFKPEFLSLNCRILLFCIPTNYNYISAVLPSHLIVRLLNSITLGVKATNESDTSYCRCRWAASDSVHVL